MLVLTLIPNAIVHVDPHVKYGVTPSNQEAYIRDAMGVLLSWFREMDLKEQPLSDVWNHYPFGKPSKDNKVQIIDGKYHYPNDPVLSPLVTIRTDVKGYDEEFHIYPYSLTAYLVKGELINHGRMD
jgi:hypothetical protein